MDAYYIFLVILLSIILYVYSYYTYPENIAILQSRPHEFSTDMLLEKQPIIIENNNISTLNDLKNACFKWSPTQMFNISGSTLWHYNKFKYVAIQLETHGEIILCPPNTKMLLEKNTNQQIPDPENTNLLAIQAKANEIVILPLHWRYIISKKLDVNCMGIHDWITYFLP